MCKFFSFIVTQSKILYDLDNHSHTSILEKHGIEDRRLSPEFVRVELIPKVNLESTSIVDFRFHVDQDFRPDWFDSNVEYEACFKEYQKLLNENREAFLVSAVEQDGYIIQSIKNPSEKLQRLAVTQKGYAIQFIKNPSEKIQELAVSRNGYAIRYIKKPSEELKELAVKQDGCAIQYIKNPSEELQKLAVSEDGYAIHYINNPSEKVQKIAKKRRKGLIRSIQINN